MSARETLKRFIRPLLIVWLGLAAISLVTWIVIVFLPDLITSFGVPSAWLVEPDPHRCRLHRGRRVLVWGDGLAVALLAAAAGDDRATKTDRSDGEWRSSAVVIAACRCRSR